MNGLNHHHDLDKQDLHDDSEGERRGVSGLGALVNDNGLHVAEDRGLTDEPCHGAGDAWHRQAEFVAQEPEDEKNRGLSLIHI